MTDIGSLVQSVAVCLSDRLPEMLIDTKPGKSRITESSRASEDGEDAHSRRLHGFGRDELVSSDGKT